MTTLTEAPLVPLIERLFADAEQKDAAFFASRADRADAIRSDFRDFYTRAKDAYLPVSRETAKQLYILARATNARTIVEYGTSFGISTLHLAAAVRDTWGIGGGGRVIGSEFEPGKIAAARANLTEGGLADLVEIREGDARETLSRDLPDAIDLVLLDGHKAFYGEVLALLEPQLRKGALIVADNADMCPEFIQAVRGRSDYLSVPLTDEVELSIRL